MKLLFVTRYVDHVLLYFLRELANHVSLRVVYESENRWNGPLADAGVATIRLVPKWRFDKRFQQGIESLYRVEAFDLMQCFHGNAQLANLIQWNRRNLPLVAYRGRIGHLKLRESPAAYWSVRHPRLAATVANSSAVKNYLDAFSMWRPRNVRVIPTGVNLDWIRTRSRKPFGLRAKLGVPTDALIVASMGSLRPVKNFRLVVEAASQLAADGVQFVHLGEPMGWDRRTQAVNNLHYLPFEHNPFPVIAEADVFGSTSHKEAFSRASLEAMACGKAVIGPRAGGSLDLIEDGVSGRLFAPDDSRDFAAKVRWYHDDRRRVSEHGEAAVRRVESYFSTDSMVTAYLRLYSELTATPP